MAAAANTGSVSLGVARRVVASVLTARGRCTMIMECTAGDVCVVPVFRAACRVSETLQLLFPL